MNKLLCLFFFILLIVNNLVFSQTKEDTTNIIKESIFWMKFSYYIYPKSISQEEKALSNIRDYINNPKKEIAYINKKDIKYKFDYHTNFESKPIFNNSWLDFVFVNEEEYAKELKTKMVISDTSHTIFSCYDLLHLEIQGDTAKAMFQLTEYYISLEKLVPFVDDVCCILTLRKINNYWIYIPD